MLIELKDEQIKHLMDIINNTTVQGSSVEIVAKLKKDIQTPYKKPNDK